MKVIILMGLALFLLSIADMLLVNAGCTLFTNFLTACIVMLLIIFVAAIA